MGDNGVTCTTFIRHAWLGGSTPHAIMVAGTVISVQLVHNLYSGKSPISFGSRTLNRSKSRS